MPILIRSLVGASVLLGAVLAAAKPVMADDAVASAPPEPGVWQKHEYSFAFMGFTSTYSCDGLASELKILLIAAGARSDVKSRPGACASGFGRPDKFARADLTFYTLAPAASASNPGTGDPAIDGVWRPVAFAYQKPRELGRGDCELVEQFRNNVLPMFTTRNVDNQTVCIPHQESGSVVDLRFESFGPPPKAGQQRQS